MTRGTRAPRGRRRSATRMSGAVVIAPAAGFFVFWLAAEAFLALRPHRLHWVAAGVGGSIGWLAVQIIYRVQRRAA
jgi:hypothetical protein